MAWTKLKVKWNVSFHLDSYLQGLRIRLRGNPVTYMISINLARNAINDREAVAAAAWTTFSDKACVRFTFTDKAGVNLWIQQ